MRVENYRFSREWEGETAFIVGGGPSVKTQNLDVLRGRRVIAINTSFRVVPFADFLIFSDARWWKHYYSEASQFSGRIVSVAANVASNRLLMVKRQRPPGLATAPDTLAVKFTTMTAAINAAAHLGAKRIVLTGADGRIVNGQCHHHGPHPWKQLPGCWEKQRQDLASLVAPLKSLGVECLNASPGSALGLWPVVSLESCL